MSSRLVEQGGRLIVTNRNKLDDLATNLDYNCYDLDD
jgi:hypothetical protein